MFVFFMNLFFPILFHPLTFFLPAFCFLGKLLRIVYVCQFPGNCCPNCRRRYLPLTAFSFENWCSMFPTTVYNDGLGRHFLVFTLLVFKRCSIARQNGSSNLIPFLYFPWNIVSLSSNSYNRLQRRVREPAWTFRKVL